MLGFVKSEVCPLWMCYNLYGGN